MKKTQTHASRKLGLKRETVRALSAIAPEQLAQVVGGSAHAYFSRSIGGGSKYC